MADDGTKWKRNPDFTSNSRWFKGPDFLWQEAEAWPMMFDKNLTTEEELRPSMLFHHQLIEPIIIANEYSNWKRLVHVTGYVLRFVSNVIRKFNKLPLVSGPLYSHELRHAEEYHLKIAQRDAYMDEIAMLHGNQLGSEPREQISKSSALYKQNPFLDENAVLRSRGRVGACEFLDEETKYPVILPCDHSITLLLLASYHEKFHHSNFEIVRNEVRQRFRVTKLKSTLGKIRKNCQRCKNKDAVPHPPEMADLPPARLAVFTRPFTHVGVDYFSPIEVVIGRRVKKRWGVLLTCLTIRAIHLEVAHSLNTNSCIMALRNFVARRGKPAAFYSDRGTNFIGAERELREAIKAINQHAIMGEFTDAETSWHFNPPASPHMGGCWKRLVQSVKRNFREVFGTRRLNDEELKNALAEIENVLNSRPLTHVPIDEESALTLNHFLLGSSDGSKPLTLFDDSTKTVKRGWEASQVMANYFWRRWVREYLPDITQRTKWFRRVKPIEVGDIVVIADPDHPRNCWPKCRVIGVVNTDGQVRRATVQTASGVLERPAVKLAVLDVNSGIK